MLESVFSSRISVIHWTTLSVQIRFTTFGLYWCLQPLRKNIVGAETLDDRSLSKYRKKIEIIFSGLEAFDIELLKNRSIQAFQFRLETILLTYALMLGKA